MITYILSIGRTAWYWLTILCLTVLYSVGFSISVLVSGLILCVSLVLYTVLKWVAVLRCWLNDTVSARKELKSSTQWDLED